MDDLLTRRQMLRLGTVALGMLPGLAVAAGAKRRADACILLYLDGGPSHIDLWDMKPDAPVEVRGPFKPIATAVPGLRVCEHLPRSAKAMGRVCQVRSVRHDETIHDPAVYRMLTGRKHPITAGNLKVAPGDFPHFASAFAHSLRGKPGAMPPAVELPETMRMEARVLPGQGAGFLGPSCEPFRVEMTPLGDVVPPPLEPRDDVRSRLAGRGALLERLDGRLRMLERGAGHDAFRRQALDLLSRPGVRRAFDLEREPVAVRERYGSHRHGRSVLLARRLVEAGARFVTVYWGKEEQDWAEGKGLRLANNPWDTHRNHFPLLRDSLLPRADQALAALVTDLEARGMLGRTMVVWMGDFGRTPRIEKKHASRDHWPGANTVLFAGAGAPGGAVIGRTDRHAAEVVERPVTPADLTATVLKALGVDPRGEMADTQGRPHVLSEGDPIRELA